MRTITAALLVAGVALGLLLPGPAAALDLKRAGTPRFPDRAFALTLPEPRTLSAADVTVRENGRPLTDENVVPGSAAGPRELGIILAIDASTSMRGEAARGAVEAARTLAAQRNPRQPIGIVTFDKRAATLLPPTTDQTKVNAALASEPELGVGTRIFDATRYAIGVMRKAGITGGSVVVLSDGADVGSRIGASETAAAAEELGVRIYSVALRSRDFNSDPLEQLAFQGGGTYSEAASVRELRQIYRDLGAQLASQYLIRYRSHAGPREPVLVTVQVDGIEGTASARYTSPALRLPAAPAFNRSLAEEFWRSQAAILAVAALITALIAIALLVVLRPRSHTMNIKRRLDAFTSPREDNAPATFSAVTERVLLETEKSLERLRWWPELKKDIEVARIPFAPVQLVALTVMSSVLVAWVVAALVGSPIIGVAAGVGTPLLVRTVLRVRLGRERFKFSDQLADHLQVVASALRAGHSFVGALSVAGKDAPEPVRTQFERAVADERLGAPVEEALDAIGDRMDNPDVPHVALVAKLQRDTGANAAEVLDRVVSTIRVRQELRRHVRAITAQQRLARGVLTVLPVAMLGILSLMNRDYLQPLFEEPAGKAMLVMAALGLIVGSYVLKKMVEIEV